MRYGRKCKMKGKYDWQLREKSYNKGMKLLITGGGGFAGRYLSEFFVNKGHSVTATYRNSFPTNAIEEVRYVKQELSNKIDIDGEFDAIVHTAVSHSGPTLPILDYVRDNIDSARQIVAYAKKRKIKTIFYFSTRNIYGQILTSEVSEESDIINPDKYGETKYIAEQIFQEADDLNTLGIRAPGIIGPGAHDIWFVNLVNKIANGEDVIVTDYNTKNLVYIKDIAVFAERIIGHLVAGNEIKYKVVNVCCDKEINNLEIASLVKERTKSHSNIIKRTDTTGLFRLNSDKAEEIGFVLLNSVVSVTFLPD